ncbi:zinc ribbon domain-containing protein [Pyrobaculum sp. 3827-6]|uniref:zinc ribbon domain-containing protein n=1 Tax=Pyrobaculum sp. 3827-6 TaxID=2983604 RepID=UPI0021D86441|nr:zinc ribbon domain-containing protein [Pyrobaculum sp. 3827-6]MCU7787521.1 zinc ribbon domain-containing protein [Pyrobaculum sp. 3827-6]
MGYRTLTIKRRVEEIPPEQLAKFLEVQQKFRQWATEWYKSGFKAPMPEQNPLKYFAEKLKYVMKLIPVNGLKNGIWRIPLPFNVQLRLSNNEEDESRGVLVDFVSSQESREEKVIKVRKWSGQRGNTIVIRLRKSEIKWIEERIREGAQLKFALAWVGKRRGSNIATFNVALVFYREITPFQPKRLLVVDINSLHNGVVWAVVEEGRVLRRGVLRPDLAHIGSLEREIARLDSLCSTKGVHCNKATALKSRLWRLWRQWTIEAAKKIVQLATQYKAAVVVDTPEDKSVRELKESDRVKPSVKKYLNVGRFTKRLRELAEWHGVPYAELRLYSTICPKCGAKMEELPNRRVKCQCGFEANRDEVPIHWAQKRYREIIPFFPNTTFNPPLYIPPDLQSDILPD